MNTRLRAFTLIEVIIVVSIIGILFAIAYPSYTNYLTKAGRTEAHEIILRVANLQEQYYLSHRQYADNLAKLGVEGTPYITSHGHYQVTTTGGDGYLITATAINAQASRDKDCSHITLTETGKQGIKQVCW